VRVLLDTHPLIWWLTDDSRLKPSAREIIADGANEILVSVVSPWEMAVKQRAGKWGGTIDELLEALQRERFSRLAIEDRHLLLLQSLPKHHKDPFDHLLVAQAVTENAGFMTRDRKIGLYPVQVLAC
jgi:PIN domain nuclease of toxin-antitoxin system